MVRSPYGSAASGAGTPAGAEDVAALFALSDLELLARVRAGDDHAFGELFSRHSGAVRRFAARNYGAGIDPEDLTAEAFFRVLQAVRRGSAHIEHTRAYLLTVARRVAWEWTSRRRDVPVDDDELARRGEPDGDRAASSDERHLIARAFTSLPERWRSVLWRVEVEGERPAVIAGYFGLSANATAALARRARDGLRAAYLQAHLADAAGPVTCRSVVQKLGAFTAGGVHGAERRRIAAHLAGCGSCTALHDELADVCAGLRAHASHVGPVAGLGTALAGGAAGSGAAGTGAGAAGGTGGAAGLAGKAAAVAGRFKVALAATAVAGVGTLGVSVVPLAGHGDLTAAPSYDGKGGDEQVLPVCTTCTPGTSGPLAMPPPRSQHPTSRSAPRSAPQPAAAPDTGTQSDETADQESPQAATEPQPQALDAATARHRALPRAAAREAGTLTSPALPSPPDASPPDAPPPANLPRPKSAPATTGPPADTGTTGSPGPTETSGTPTFRPTPSTPAPTGTSTRTPTQSPTSQPSTSAGTQAPEDTTTTGGEPATSSAPTPAH